LEKSFFASGKYPNIQLYIYVQIYISDICHRHNSWKKCFCLREISKYTLQIYIYLIFFTGIIVGKSVFASNIQISKYAYIQLYIIDIFHRHNSRKKVFLLPGNIQIYIYNTSYLIFVTGTTTISVEKKFCQFPIERHEQHFLFYWRNCLFWWKTEHFLTKNIVQLERGKLSQHICLWRKNHKYLGNKYCCTAAQPHVVEPRIREKI